MGLSGGREIAAMTYAQYLEHPLWDDFWKQISMWTKWDRVEVPVLAIGAWNDTLVPGGSPMNWIGLNKTGNPQNYLIIGPWAHGAAPAEDLPPGAQLAWFDRWLMQQPRTPLPTYPVTSYEQPFPGAGRGWQNFASWPPPGTRPVRWALTLDDEISSEPGPAGTKSYTTQPTDAGDSGANDSGAVPPGERSDQTLVFNTRPLAQELVIAGRVVLDLRASLSQADGNLKAVLYDVAPEGAATFLNEGYLKASHRLSHEAPTPVTAGDVTDFRIEIFPMHWRFADGHRVRLRIYGGHSTELTPESSPVTTTLSLGEGGSTVSLPELAGVPGTRGCLARRVRIAPRGIGRVRLRSSKATLLRRTPAPRRRTRRAWTWCVRGGKGRVTAAFTRGGRVALVKTTALGYRRRGVRPGTTGRGLRLAYPNRLALGPRLVRATPRSTVLFRTRRGRVRYVAVASRRTIARRRVLRAYLRYAARRAGR
jgi:hypothetical protein